MILLFVFKEELRGSEKGYTDHSLLCSPAPAPLQALTENKPIGLIQTLAHVSPHYKTPENLAQSAVSAQEGPRTAIAEVLEIRTQERWLSYVGKQNTRLLLSLGLHSLAQNKHTMYNTKNIFITPNYTYK